MRIKLVFFTGDFSSEALYVVAAGKREEVRIVASKEEEAWQHGIFNDTLTKGNAKSSMFYKDVLEILGNPFICFNPIKNIKIVEDFFVFNKLMKETFADLL